MKARPRILLWDPNHSPHTDGPGPKYLAHKIAPAWVFGGGTDGAVVRGGVTVRDSGIITHAGGVPLETDHRGAFLLDVRLGKGMGW